MSTTKHFDVIEHRCPGQHIRHYARGTSESEEDELYLAVKQYVPRIKESGTHGGSQGITLIACHANGAPKECYEPLWDALYEYMQKSAKTHIMSIWIADISNQGESSILNEHKLGNDPSWYDHARDYLAMVNHFRKDMKQPIVGFGHSMGGNILANVALMHPRLFTTLVLFEGVFYQNARKMTSISAYPITFRKDYYPSREVAGKSFRKHPIYRTWDPAVLDLFLKYGLRDLPTAIQPTPQSKDAPEPVTLATTKHQEAISFSRASFPPDRSTPLSEFEPTHSAHPDIGDAKFRNLDEPFYRPEPYMTFFQLPHLKPSCLWLSGADTMFGPERWARAEKAEVCGTGIGGSGGMAAGRVEERELPQGGHYMPFEAPQRVAVDALGPWLDKEVGRWAEEVKEGRKAWNQVDKSKRSQFSDDWIWWMKTHNDPRKVTKAMRVKL